MIRNVGVRITGLPKADNHVDAFKEVEDACFADNLKEYTPFENLANDEVSVTMKIKAIIDFTSEGAAPESCQEDAIKKFTGLTDFSGCDYPALQSPPAKRSQALSYAGEKLKALPLLGVSAHLIQRAFYGVSRSTCRALAFSDS